MGGFAQMHLWDDEVWIWCRSINPSGATDQNLPVSCREVAWLSSPRATGVRPGLVTMMKVPFLRIENLPNPYPAWLIFAILEGGWECHLWVRLIFCGWLHEAHSDDLRCINCIKGKRLWWRLNLASHCISIPTMAPRSLLVDIACLWHTRTSRFNFGLVTVHHVAFSPQQALLKRYTLAEDSAHVLMASSSSCHILFKYY